MKADFAALPWEQSAPGVRFKAIKRDGKRLRLVEFTKEFVEREWCLKDHTGYVLEGEMEITFDGTTERFAAGDGVFIARGERHRTRVMSPLIRLVLVEDDE